MDDVIPDRRFLPVEKFRRRLASSNPQQSARLTFLSISGAFNPVHTQHVRAAELARIELERIGRTVVAGFFGPSSDRYVSSKSGKDALCLKKRIELCELATRNSDWIDVCPWGEHSSNRLRIGIRDYLSQNCAELLQGHPISAVEIMGSDTAIRILDKTATEWRKEQQRPRQPWFPGRVLCCLVRPGPRGRAEQKHIAEKTVPQAADLGVQIMVVDTSSSQEPLEAVSSEEIRRFAAKHDWAALRTRGWLAPEVLDRLMTWSEDQDCPFNRL